MRRAATVHLSMLVAGDRYEAAFLLKPGRHWSRFKSPGLPHLAGCHLYVEQRPRGLRCKIVPNNGTLEADRTWRGVFACSDLRLEVRGPYVVAHAADDYNATGNVFEITPPGTSYTFHPRASHRWTFACAKTIEDARAVLLYQDEADWTPHRGDYGPHELRLPDTSPHASTYHGTYAAKRDRAGIALVRPKGVESAPKDGMNPGGDGIEPDGHGMPLACGNVEAARVFVLHSEAAFHDWMDRVGPHALYDAKGRQLGPHSFPSPVLPAGINKGPAATNRDLPPFLVMEEGHGNQRYRRLTPDGDVSWWNWQEVATSHMIRVFRHGISHWEATGDQATRDALVSLSQARVMLDWQHRADCPIQPEGTGGYWPESLTDKLAKAHRRPGIGIGMDRAGAWMAELQAQCLRMGHGSAATWLERWAELVEVGSHKDGITQASYYAPSYTPENVLSTQFFHDALIKWAYAGVCRQLDRDGGQLLRLWVNRTLNNPALPFEKYPWNDKAFGPPWFIAVQIDGQAVSISGENATGCGKPGWSTGYGGCIEHILPVCAEAYRFTNDAAILQVSLGFWEPHATLAERYAWLKEASDLNWKAAMLSVLEEKLALALV